jgi:hypothetical protein
MKAQPWIAKVKLNELSKQELRDLIMKVETLYKQLVPPIQLDIRSHASMAKRQ